MFGFSVSRCYGDFFDFPLLSGNVESSQRCVCVLVCVCVIEAESIVVQNMDREKNITLRSISLLQMFYIHQVGYENPPGQ